jgi:nucleotide-binding universal stress UspA family protein
MNVLIATDGSDIAGSLAAHAGALLGEPTAVTVLAVVTEIPGDDAGGIEGPTESPEEAERVLEGEQRDAAAAIDRVVADLPSSWQAKVTRRIEAGDAGAMIVWVAEHEASDVIVIGSHGHGLFKRLVLGSVSNHVTHHAPCPVLLVRAQES